ncbi:outer mitochondrial transmembrane helix translocase-like [Gigantopelta aegis]|uniref:outer mitochondrial transmembrane helix translocase-like n=1 Tax=Gigantopelta aegis TaxID=1735272 RepID=UPI001B889715|nr:outer mitochondrial transmembrane helix translocase-like [Gigantopelta aegis]
MLKAVAEGMFKGAGDVSENASAKNELLAKIISTLIGLTASFTITYFGVRYLMNAMDPTQKDKKESRERAQRMLKRLGVDNAQKLSEYELCIASNLVDPRDVDVSWTDIGGLDSIISEIQETVILPFKNTSLFQNSSLLQAPKGVLLYGPPGCGKTMIAKATAKAAGARFLNLQISSLVDKWYGESQKRAEAVFSLAIKLQPTIIFIDEIDSFLRSRSSTDHEATAMIKTQFMSFWDGLITDKSCNVMVMGATNRRPDVDAAILRRMPSQFRVGLPAKEQRAQIFRMILRDEKTDELKFPQLGDITDGFSGSDIREVCRAAAVSTVHEYMHNHRNGSDISNDDMHKELRGIRMDDLNTAVTKVKMTKNVSLLLTDSIPMDR